MGEGAALTAFLLLAHSQPPTTERNNYDAAIKAAAQATFIQSGLKDVTDQTLKVYELTYRQMTPKHLQTVMGWSIWVAKIVQDGKLTYSWSF